MINDISCKTLTVLKSFRIRSDKIDIFIINYDGNTHLVLFGPEIYGAIYNRIRYLISLKSSVAYIFSQYYAKIKVDSYASLPLEKILN